MSNITPIRLEGTPTFYWYRKGTDFGNATIQTIFHCSVGTILGGILGYFLVTPIARPSSKNAILAIVLLAIGVATFCLFRSLLAGRKCLMTASQMKHFTIDFQNRRICAVDEWGEKEIPLFNEKYLELDADQAECAIFACGNPNINLLRALDATCHTRARVYKDFVVRIEISRNQLDDVIKATKSV